MGQLAEATQILDTVKATVIASGQALPPELISKQDDLEVTKRLVSQVVQLTAMVILLLLQRFKPCHTE